MGKSALALSMIANAAVRSSLPCAFFSLETGAGGDASTVNVGAYRRDGSFLMTDGPSYRQVVVQNEEVINSLLTKLGQPPK